MYFGGSDSESVACIYHHILLIAFYDHSVSMGGHCIHALFLLIGVVFDDLALGLKVLAIIALKDS
jgi:hypothetical protein